MSKTEHIDRYIHTCPYCGQPTNDMDTPVMGRRAHQNCIDKNNRDLYEAKRAWYEQD